MKSKCTKLSLHSVPTKLCWLVVLIAFGVISQSGSCSGEVITVNGQRVDPHTLTFTTSAPLSVGLAPRIQSRSYSETVLPIKETPSPGGFWKTRQEWKPYWVKDWTVKKIYVPVWKRVWGPAEVREWVPTGVAKPHPGPIGSKHGSIIH